MNAPAFRDWLIAVAPRFPHFGPLAAFVARDNDWPLGYDKSELRRHLRTHGQGELAGGLAQALDAFEVLCMPSMSIPENDGLPWEWHSPRVLETTKASLKRHSRHRRVPTHKYRWQLGQRLAAEMAQKTRIYVDTCHWVKMRDFELGRAAGSAYGDILANLRRLVKAGRCICPLSPALFLELQTQTDPTTRLHTAQLMEELSQSIGLPHLDEMEKLELRRRAFHTIFGAGELNTDWQVWTKAVFLLGEVSPPPPAWFQSEEEVWWFQKSFLDSVWDAPFTQILGVLLESVDTKQVREDFAKVLNDDRETRPAADFEFERQRAIAMVMRHVLLPAMLKITAELERIAEKRPGFQMPKIHPPTEPDPWCLPSVQIIAEIEALIRTSGRRFRDNDMFDLFHCAAAIPYCQVFFCDTAFKHIVTDPKLRHDVKYGVKVLAAPDEILAFLQTQ